MPIDSTEVVVQVERELDVVCARQKARELAAALGFSTTDQTLVATAISEVARNIVCYAGNGTVLLQAVEENGRRGLLIVADDRGPGIENMELAMRDGYSTGKSLGLGLPGAKRLVDSFELRSVPGAGTTITMRKWLR